MGTLRQPDPFVTCLLREHLRAIECIEQIAQTKGEARAHMLTEARRILIGLADAEDAVLLPALSRTRLRAETQFLADDARGDRAQQLSLLDQLARRRGARAQKLMAVQLADEVRRYGELLTGQLVPVLSSQLPRLLYRSISNGFLARYRGDAPQMPSSVPSATTVVQHARS